MATTKVMSKITSFKCDDLNVTWIKTLKKKLSNRTATNIVCDCYIREFYKPVFELGPATQMTTKSDPSDSDMRIDPT